MHIFTTQVYFIGKVKILHASTATKNYLPHRFVACFKVKQVKQVRNKPEDNRNYYAVRAEAKPTVTTKLKVNTAKKTMKKGKGIRELKSNGIVTIRHLPHRPNRHTGLITTQDLSPHRSYHHTGLITTQVLSPPSYNHTRLINTQVLSPHRSYNHTGLITTQDYFLTGLFCHRFILHMGPLCAFLPHRSISLARSKYCTPHLPQRTIFHTGLLHALRSHVQVFTKR